jgi:phosphopantothenoylcysteine decarboxylase/phosphopantothenate--cysteine ligase
LKKEKTVILGVTASIAIYKACDIVRALRNEGINVVVLMSARAEELVRPLVFQSLSGNKVHRGMFEEPEAWQIEHIGLAEQADCVLIAPATANVIAKIAGGICDDLLTCVVCATKAPVVIAPAMNENMYLNRITQGNIKKLEGLGYKFCSPRCGKLACGKTGTGCLAAVEDIVKQVKGILK